MIKIPLELRVARAQADGKHAEVIGQQNKLSANIAFVTMAENGMIDDVTATEHADIFVRWSPGQKVATNAIRAYSAGEIIDAAELHLYKCISAHTTQQDWPPDKTPALWREIGDPNAEWPEWSQPICKEDAYKKGDKVTHEGIRWESDYDANTWTPGVFGWTVAL